MGIKITISDPDNIKGQLKDLPKRFSFLKQAIGNSIAESIRSDVIRNIPKGPGWLNIYRKSIDISYDKKGEWVVAGERQIPITKVDATTTLILFSGGDKASAILMKYNPWPIDSVPAINAIYVSKIIMRAASTSEVERARDLITTNIEQIKSKLSSAGFSITLGELPKFGSEAIADLSFLAQRLENGLGNFPRVPVWGMAAANITANIANTLKATTSKFDKILRGEVGKTLKTPSSDLKKMLASAVRKSPK